MRTKSLFREMIIKLMSSMHERRKMILTLSCLVVFVTTYTLILPAFTLDKEEASEQGGIDAPVATEQISENDSETTQEQRYQQPEPENTENTISGEDNKYKVTLSYEGSVIPDGASLSVSELENGSDDYLEALDLVVKEKKEADESFNADSMGFAAVDISILDENGEEIEPAGEVAVKIEMKELPVEADKDTLASSMEIRHIVSDEEKGKAELVADTSNNGSTIAVDNNIAVAEFTTDSFSTYTISWGRAYSSNRKNITVHYGYMEGNEFKEFTDQPYDAFTHYGAPTQIGDQFDLRRDIEGYEYVGTRLQTPNGTPIHNLLATASKAGAWDWTGNGWNYNSAGDYSYWKYRELTSINTNYPGEWNGYGINQYQPFTNQTDIYVLYRKPPEASGSTIPDVQADAPKTEKNATVNGDGTYDLSLSVTGSSAKAEGKNRVNVAIVLDTSNSMEGTKDEATGRDLGATRLAIAQETLKTLGKQLLDNNKEDKAGDPATVEIAFVNFSNKVRNEQEISSNFYTKYSDFEDLIDSLNTNGGTNWDLALDATNNILWNDDDPVYVIFISDGDTNSRSYADGYYNDWDGGTYYVSSTDPAGLARARAAAAKQAAKITSGGDKLYTIGVFGNVQYLGQLNPTKNFGSVSDKTALENAFKEMVTTITAELNYQDVEIKDGLTDLAHTAFLSNSAADVGKFKYYRKGGKNPNGSEKYNSAANGGKGEEWVGAPEASFSGNANDQTNKSVTWNLGNDFTLEDGVTYTVSFTVWPAQEAYDILADLNNGLKFYDYDSYLASDPDPTLTEEQAVANGLVLDEDTRKQIVEKDGKYSVKTNTSASVEYKTVTYVSGQSTPSVSAPKSSPIADPKQTMGLDESRIKVRKDWDVSLDPTQLLNVLDSNPDYKAELAVKAENDDGSSAHTDIPVIIKPEVERDGSGKATSATWPTKEIYIAPGVMVSRDHAIEKGLIKENQHYPDYKYKDVKYNGDDYVVLETGHTYSFDESHCDWHFELEAGTHHPMVVDGVEKDITFKTEGGETIAIATSDDATLVATNKLRSGVNIVKHVTDSAGNDVDDDHTFYVKLTLRDKNGKEIKYKDYLRKDTTESGDYAVGEIESKEKVGDHYWLVKAWNAAHTRTYTYYSLNEDGRDQIDQDAYPIWYNDYASYTEDADGKISGVGNWTLDSMWESGEVKAIKKGQLLQLKNVPYGTTVVLTEVAPQYDSDGNITGYTDVALNGTFDNYKLTGLTYKDGKSNWDSTVDYNKSYRIDVTNQVTEKEVLFRKADIRSKGETDESKIIKLDDAEFELTKVNGSVSVKQFFDTKNNNKVMSLDEVEKKLGIKSDDSAWKTKLAEAGISSTFKFNINGSEVSLKLPTGTYKLKEIAAPEGYVIASSDLQFVLTNEGVTATGDYIAAGKLDSKPLVTVYNEQGAELPHAGGIGTTVFYIIGSLLTLGCTVLMISRRRLRNC